VLVEQARAAATVEQLCMTFAPPGQQRRVDVFELHGAGLGLSPMEDAGRPTAADMPELVSVEPEGTQLVAEEIAREAPPMAEPRAALVGPPPEVRGWTPYRKGSPRAAEVLEQLRAALGPELVPETEAPAKEEGQTVTKRLLGRSGAPRWGALGPRPAKVRLVLPQVEEPEEEQGGRPTPLK
jgi:hypothetical protein